jgi:hypothetical protein
MSRPLREKSVNDRLVGMAAPEKYTEIEQKLGQSLRGLISQRRDEGVAWRRIALEVSARTGVDITGETLRVWHQGISPVESPASAA